MEHINKNHALTKPPVNPNFETKDYKIVRVAYDDEGTNMFVLVDKKKRDIISYSISGNAERSKFKNLTENMKKDQAKKIIENILILRGKLTTFIAENSNKL